MTSFLDIILQILKLFAISLGIGILAFFIERIRPAQKNVSSIKKKDTPLEFGLYIFNGLLLQPFLIFFLSLLTLYILRPYFPFQIFDAEISRLPFILQVFIGVFLYDFAIYFRHRFTHIYAWSYHAIHHEVKEITWTTTWRMHPGDAFLASLFNLIVMHILGFSAETIIYSQYIIMAFNYMTHMNIDLDWGTPFRYVITSPNYHRWHHGIEKEAINKNYCLVFPIFDIVFGSYYFPKHLPKGYGISRSDMPEDLKGNLLYPFKKNWLFIKKLASKKKT